MKSKDYYEAMYGEYRSRSPSSLARLCKKLEIYREDAAFRLLDGGERFLDIGCGEGWLVFLAAQKYSQVYGIDISVSRIQRAQERARKRREGKIHFQAADVSESIPFDNAYFDAVSCVATLEHVFNTPRLIQEFNRVLKVGGELVIVTSNIAYLLYRIRALLGKPPKISTTGDLMDGGVLHYFTLSSLVSLLKESGFHVVRKGTAGKLCFLRRWWVSLLGSSLIIKAIKS